MLYEIILKKWQTGEERMYVDAPGLMEAYKFAEEQQQAYGADSYQVFNLQFPPKDAKVLRLP